MATTAADDRPSAPPVVVLSHHLWQSTYGADPSVVGATLVIEGHPFTVAGVTAPGFFGETLRGDPPDIWIPLQQEPLINGETSMAVRTAAALLSMGFALIAIDALIRMGLRGPVAS